MLGFCVKTDEYLADILDRVSRGAEYYLQIDADQSSAKTLIEKWTQRYHLDQTPRQRTYRLKTSPVLDLIVVQTQSMFKLGKIRLCLLITLPSEHREKYDVKLAETWVTTALELDKSQREQFSCIQDRKTRLTFGISSPKEREMPVYELVELPFTKAERKQKELTKQKGWTWRLHKDFIKVKQKSIEQTFKVSQGTKDKRLNLKELNILWSMAGFRGVRNDIFKLNRSLYPLSHKYRDKPLDLEPQVPRYTIKSKRLVNNLEAMLVFHQPLTVK
ncbi:hypothetical protein ACWKWF_15205 [Acinetobacter kookii]